MQICDFDQFCLYMESFANLEKKTDGYTTRMYRLDRMHALLQYIGNPHHDFTAIHIAGSKGKGSTAAFIAKGLSAAGHKTGLYTSPHLVNYRERFTLSGVFFPEEDLVAAAQELLDRMLGFHFEDEWGTAEPTAFELYTAFAFLLFSVTGCTWAVIETGLGGRLDATNTIIPAASVLTPIELEHTAILGHTIELIATEKSKIIKPKVPVFLSRQPDDARAVFIAEAAEQQSRWYDLEAEVEALATKTKADGEHVCIEWRKGERTQLRLAMRGEVQAENCALALLVLRTLGQYIPEKTERALETAVLPGRMQVLTSTPPLIIDGAHTVESLRHLLNSFTQLYGNRGNTVIYGALEGKDHHHMTQLLLPLFDRIIISRPGTFKKSDPEGLYRLMQKEVAGLREAPELYLILDPIEALKLALSRTEEDHAILCTGSFYLGGELVRAYAALNEEHEEVAVCP
jgi:dihydrofolate synthase/folylpolyglutamate synthase